MPTCYGRRHEAPTGRASLRLLHCARRSRRTQGAELINCCMHVTLHGWRVIDAATRHLQVFAFVPEMVALSPHILAAVFEPCMRHGWQLVAVQDSVRRRRRGVGPGRRIVTGGSVTSRGARCYGSAQDRHNWGPSSPRPPTCRRHCFRPQRVVALELAMRVCECAIVRVTS